MPHAGTQLSAGKDLPSKPAGTRPVHRAPKQSMHANEQSSGNERPSGSSRMPSHSGQVVCSGSAACSLQSASTRKPDPADCCPATSPEASAQDESDGEAKLRRQQNIKAMLNNTLVAERQSVMPRYLKVCGPAFPSTCAMMWCASLCCVSCMYFSDSIQATLVSVLVIGSRPQLSQLRSLCMLSICLKLMARALQILEGQKQLRKPFAPPVDGQPAQSEDLRRRLSARRRFVPWGGGTANFVPHYLQVAAAADVEEQAVEELEIACPNQAVAKPSGQQEPEVAPLVLWQPGRDCVSLCCDYDQLQPRSSQVYIDDNQRGNGWPPVRLCTLSTMSFVCRA
jgi:hypothetical protein